MMTKEQQLKVLNAQNALARKKLIEIRESIDKAVDEHDKEKYVDDLYGFASNVVDRLISKNGEAEQIIQMWINFNKMMEEHPHVGDRWNELMAIMTLVN